MSRRRGAPESEGASAPERQRLDAWLCCARMARTRGAAARLVDAGAVRLNGQRATAAHRPVRVGDVLTLALPHATLAVRVLVLAERRGPATEARGLYEVLAGGTAPAPDLRPESANEGETDADDAD